MTQQQRGRRLLTAALGLLTLLSTGACGASSRHSTAAAAPSVVAATSTPPVVAATSTSPVEQKPKVIGHRSLSEAISATTALRSYSFSSTQTVGNSQTNRSSLVGRAIRPSSVTYTLTAKGRTTQVVRLVTATYLRQLPHNWSKLKHPTARVDPVTSLIKLLTALGNTTERPAADGTLSISGTIPSAGARRVGLPAGSRDAAVVVILNSHHQVTRLTITAFINRPGTSAVRLVLVTDYGTFNAVPPLKPPL